MYFVPVQVLVHFEVQNPMHLFICILILFLLLADILDAYGIFCFPCRFLKGQVHFSCKGFTIWRLIGPFSEPDSGFRKLELFPFEMSICLKSYACTMHFLPVFAVFLNMWSYWWYSYLVWWPPPQELESALGGGDHIYIYIYVQGFPESTKTTFPMVFTRKSCFCFQPSTPLFSPTWNTDLHYRYEHTQAKYTYDHMPTIVCLV